MVLVVGGTAAPGPEAERGKTEKVGFEGLGADRKAVGTI